MHASGRCSMEGLDASLPPPSGPPRILVVDDDESRRTMYARVLSHEGYEVDALDDGDLVVEHVRNAPPDLILLDVQLPGASGFEVCGDLRMMDEGLRTPIILLSAAFASEGDVVRGLLCGADDYVVTPKRLDELKARVRVQLRNRRDRELLQWVRQQRSSFRRAAMNDSLTGIPNRRAAEYAMREALSHAAPFVAMLLDVDHFKKVNDTWGHEAGDLVLKSVADGLARLTRRGDIVARFGGEEFVLLIRGAPKDLAPSIAERFRAGVEALTFDGCGVPGVTASIGVATWDGEGRAPAMTEMLRQADAALYEAKDAGRNRVCVRDVASGGQEKVA